MEYYFLIFFDIGYKKINFEDFNNYYSNYLVNYLYSILIYFILIFILLIIFVCYIDIIIDR